MIKQLHTSKLVKHTETKKASLQLFRTFGTLSLSKFQIQVFEFGKLETIYSNSETEIKEIYNSLQSLKEILN